LDGMPLAIELASADQLTDQGPAARLDNRFALLTLWTADGSGFTPPDIASAIDWSYSLLSAEEQTMLRRLAVFPAGCTLDTAEAVCSEVGIAKEQILDLLSSLVNKSLLIAETTGRPGVACLKRSRIYRELNRV
jgi:predicted ATPase